MADSSGSTCRPLLAFVRAALAGLMLGLVAACAATSPPGAGAPGSMRDPFADLDRTADPAFAPLAELRLCEGFEPFNMGPIGADGRVWNYRPTVETPAGPVFVAPTDGACLSSGFGDRPWATGGLSRHRGIDLAPRGGLTVYAAAPARVAGVGWLGAYGYSVRLEHGAGVETLYAHLDPEGGAPAVGAFLRAGAPIGRMGATGRATGVHLHYEILISGRALDPLAGAASDLEQAVESLM